MGSVVGVKVGYVSFILSIISRLGKEKSWLLKAFKRTLCSTEDLYRTTEEYKLRGNNKNNTLKYLTTGICFLLSLFLFLENNTPIDSKKIKLICRYVLSKGKLNRESLK